MKRFVERGLISDKFYPKVMTQENFVTLNMLA